jgi:hypothetical protein
MKRDASYPSAAAIPVAEDPRNVFGVSSSPSKRRRRGTGTPLSAAPADDEAQIIQRFFSELPAGWLAEFAATTLPEAGVRRKHLPFEPASLARIRRILEK